MRIIARSTLNEFATRLEGHAARSAVKSALDSWFHHVKAAHWNNPADVRRDFATASVISSDRVVFNIKGNDYRLVVRINYPYRVVYVRFVGTHAQYDQIDVKEV